MAYVCDSCCAAQMSKWRDDIFERYPTDEPIEEDY